MKACLKAKTVRRLIFTSSAGTVNVSEDKKHLYDETCWSDVEFCRRVKMTGWVSVTYFMPSLFSLSLIIQYARTLRIYIKSNFLCIWIGRESYDVQSGHHLLICTSSSLIICCFLIYHFFNMTWLMLNIYI